MTLIPIGKEFSPKTKTLTETALLADVIVIDNDEGEGIDAFPDVPVGRVGHAVLSETEDYSSEDPLTYELIYYGIRDAVDGELQDVERGVAGVARVWPAGTVITCHITEAQIQAIVTRLKTAEDNILINELDATTAPTATDDSSEGYSVGSMWVVDNEQIYICVDATADAAVWQYINKSIPEPPPAPEVTEQTSTSVTITGATGTQVRIDSGDWYDSPHEFTGLDSATRYTAYARYAGTATQWPSFASVGTPFDFWFRYGFRITKSEGNTSDRVTYLYDAVGMTPAYMDYNTGTFNYGDWGDFVKEINRPVMLKYDGTVDYELSPTDQTKKLDGVTASGVDNVDYAGNAMSEFKLLYVYRYEDENYEYVIFSDGPYDENYKAYAHTDAGSNIKDAFYFAMFEGTYVGTRLRSIGTGTVMVSQTATTEITRAIANGTGAGPGGTNVDGYWTFTASQWNFINDLLTLISKRTDTQTSFGNGVSNHSAYLAAGTLKATGQFMGYNSTTQAVKVFYIENVLWGNYWMRMAGLVMTVAGKILVKMTPSYPTPSGDTVNVTGFVDSDITPSGTSGGYLKTSKMGGTIGYVPSVATGGSSSTYWADGLWFTIGSTVKYALVGATRFNAGLCGGRTVYLTDPASSADTYIGSALSFL